jgi:hypothetical protein
VRAGSPEPAAPPATTAPAPPDDTEQRKARAQEHLSKGNQQLQDGAYLQALKSFEAAYREYASPKIHFNIGQAANELGQLVKALYHYEQFVAGFRKEDAPQLWEVAHQRIFKLQEQVGTILLQINIPGAEVSVDGEPIGQSPITKPLRFAPGPHVVQVGKPGFEKHVATVKVQGGVVSVARVKLLTEAEAMAMRKEVQRLEAERRRITERLARERAEAEAARQGRLRALRRGGWSALGIGAGLLVVSVVVGGLNLGEVKKVEDASTGVEWSTVASHDKSARTLATVFYTTLGVGLAAAAAGGVLLYLGRHRAERSGEPGAAPAAPSVMILPSVGPGGFGASAMLRF